MFSCKAHISEFLYFSKIHTDLRKAVHRNQNTLLALCVFLPPWFSSRSYHPGSHCGPSVQAQQLSEYLSSYIHLPGSILLADHTAPAEHSSRLGSVEGVAQLKLEVEAPNVSYLMEIA